MSFTWKWRRRKKSFESPGNIKLGTYSNDYSHYIVAAIRIKLVEQNVPRGKPARREQPRFDKRACVVGGHSIVGSKW